MIGEGQKMKEKQKQREKDEKHKQQSKTLNTNSEKYIAQKLSREFDSIIMEMFSQNEASEAKNDYESEENKIEESQKQILKKKKLNYLR